MIRHWREKFRNAFAGIYWGAIGESSFAVHCLAALVVLVLGSIFQCESWEWCVLLLCIGGVVALELMNSAVEHLAKGLCSEQNKWVGQALDIASGSVLCFSLFTVGVGGLIFLPKLMEWLWG